MTADELNARYDPMTRDELIAECEQYRSLLSIAQDRNAEHCAEVQRLEARENEIAKVVAWALSCVNYHPEHGAWLAAAAKWLNKRPGGDVREKP